MRPPSRPGAHPGGLTLPQSECFSHLGVNGGGGLNRCFDGDDEPVANAFLLLETPSVIHAPTTTCISSEVLFDTLNYLKPGKLFCIPLG